MKMPLTIYHEWLTRNHQFPVKGFWNILAYVQMLIDTQHTKYHASQQAKRKVKTFRAANVYLKYAFCKRATQQKPIFGITFTAKGFWNILLSIFFNGSRVCQLVWPSRLIIFTF